MSVSPDFNADERRYISNLFLDNLELLNSQKNIPGGGYDAARLVACRVLVGDSVADWVERRFTDSKLDDAKKGRVLAECRARVEKMPVEEIRPMVDKLRELTLFNASLSGVDGETFVERVFGGKLPKPSTKLFYIACLSGSEKREVVDMLSGRRDDSQLEALVNIAPNTVLSRSALRDSSIHKQPVLVRDKNSYFRINDRIRVCIESGDVAGVDTIVAELEGNFARRVYHQTKDGENFLGEIDAHASFLQEALESFAEKGIKVPVGLHRRFVTLKGTVDMEKAFVEEGCRNVEEYFAKKCLQVPGATKPVADALVSGVKKVCVDSHLDERETFATLSFLTNQTRVRLVERACRMVEAGGSHLVPDIILDTYFHDAQVELRRIMLVADKFPFERFWAMNEGSRLAPLRGRIDDLMARMDDVDQRNLLSVLMSSPTVQQAESRLGYIEHPERMNLSAVDKAQAIRFFRDSAVLDGVLSLVDSEGSEGIRRLIAQKSSSPREAVRILTLAQGLDYLSRLPSEMELMLMRDMVRSAILHPGEETLVRKALTPYLKVARQYDTLYRQFNRLDLKSPTFTGDVLLLHYNAIDFTKMMQELYADLDDPDVVKSLKFFTLDELRECQESVEKIGNGVPSLKDEEVFSVSDHNKALNAMQRSCHDLFIMLSGETMKLVYPNDGWLLGEECAELGRAWFERFREPAFHRTWDLKNGVKK